MKSSSRYSTPNANPFAIRNRDGSFETFGRARKGFVNARNGNLPEADGRIRMEGKRLMKLNVEQTRLLLSRALDLVADQRDHLNELDRGLGDGDHGTTIARGARAAIDLLETAPLVSVNDAFTSAGRAMMKSMGGASGVLFGTFFQGANTCPTSTVLETGILSGFFKSGLDNLKQKSKAGVGDKTMVDAIVPAVGALALDAAASEPFDVALQHAADAAEKGAQSTIGLLPRFGRARTLGERASAGQDPGATTIGLFMRGLADSLPGVMTPKAQDQAGHG